MFCLPKVGCLLACKQQNRSHLEIVRFSGHYGIGSGEIESGHRHVIQKRLKLAGAWWKQTNAQAMLNLRCARTNNQWSHHWMTKN